MGPYKHWKKISNFIWTKKWDLAKIQATILTSKRTCFCVNTCFYIWTAHSRPPRDWLAITFSKRSQLLPTCYKWTRSTHSMTFTCHLHVLNDSLDYIKRIKSMYFIMFQDTKIFLYDSKSINIQITTWMTKSMQRRCGSQLFLSFLLWKYEWKCCKFSLHALSIIYLLTLLPASLLWRFINCLPWSFVPLSTFISRSRMSMKFFANLKYKKPWLMNTICFI